MNNPVREALLNARLREASPFERWCILRRLQPLPAAPAYVAAFVRDTHELPIEKIWDAVQEVSQSHMEHGLADPTAGGPVAEAINEVSKIDPPRSWPHKDHGDFKRLPYPVQRRTADRDNKRDREVRRLQNELATTRQQLKSLQDITVEKTNDSEIKTSPDASA